MLAPEWWAQGQGASSQKSDFRELWFGGDLSGFSQEKTFLDSIDMLGKQKIFYPDGFFRMEFLGRLEGLPFQIFVVRFGLLGAKEGILITRFRNSKFSNSFKITQDSPTMLPDTPPGAAIDANNAARERFGTGKVSGNIVGESCVSLSEFENLEFLNLVVRIW